MTDDMPRRARTGRGRLWLRVGGGALAVVLVAVGGLWLSRKPIADYFIAETLRDYGIAGRYRIVKIGPGLQRVEDVSLGDPDHPDLTARWVELRLGYGFFGAQVQALRAGGVRLRARIDGDGLHLGALDPLLSGGSGGAVSLPDLIVSLEDARADVATMAGPLVIALDGAGNLQSGFLGTLHLAANRLDQSGCTLDSLDAPLKLSTQAGRIMLKGPLAAKALDCGADRLVLAAPKIEADLRTDAALDDLSGAFSLSSSSAHQGDRRLDSLSGLVTVQGSAQALEGSVALAAATTDLGVATTADMRFGGTFALRPGARDRAYSFVPTLTVEGLRPTDETQWRDLTAGLESTPLAPLAGRLADALVQAGQANRLTLTGRLDGDGRVNRVSVSGAQFVATSGARLALVSGADVRLDLGSGLIEMRGDVEMHGGGLPEARLSIVTRPGGALSGVLTMADYRAGSARLGLEPVRFSRSGAGAVRFSTQVTLDGPLGDGGAVSGLVVPLAGRVSSAGAFSVSKDCAPLRWQLLDLGAAAFDAAQVELCGLKGDTLRAEQVSLSGRVGESPLRLSAKTLDYALSAGRFGVTALDAAIGAGENPVHFTAARLDGALAGDGTLAGSLDEATAVIGPVPLYLSRIGGQWRFAEGGLSVDGQLRVTDAQADARFEPLAANDVRLTMVDGMIRATGTLTPPFGAPQVASLVIRHDLGSGVGHADIKVDQLRFGGGLQPDDLTQLALGIIANVDGIVDGQGAIDWSSEGVTASTGTFSTQDMNFAAAFGPVTGFSTRLDFVDLLNMQTAPHQHMTIDQVSAGVDVFDGVIDYQLLSNQQALIEDGRWPFSGGTLELLPATLALDADQPRHLTFRVVGLDAGGFINTMQLENISATGTFDGLFPMIFDRQGGRIEGGILVARQQGFAPLILGRGEADELPVCDASRDGGDLSYVGAVSDAELGFMSKVAFDVLKHLRYRCLTVRLDGALDGEFVTNLSVNGINRGGDDGKASFLARPFLGLPFIFNVRIEAPFRGLLGTAVSLSDPRQRIREELDKERMRNETNLLAVQPRESDNAIEGKQK